MSRSTSNSPKKPLGSGGNEIMALGKRLTRCRSRSESNFFSPVCLPDRIVNDLQLGPCVVQVKRLEDEKGSWPQLLHPSRPQSNSEKKPSVVPAGCANRNAGSRSDFVDKSLGRKRILEEEKERISSRKKLKFGRQSQLSNSQIWTAYGLDTVPCKLGSCSSRKCKNPYCLNRLGHEKWDSLVEKYKKKVDKQYPFRDVKQTPAGLKNLGNTCYLNSYLQVWFHLLPFRYAVYKWEKLPDGFWPVGDEGKMDAEETMLALQHLFLCMDGAPYESFSPSRIIKALQLNTDQQDALEFGQLFSNMLKECVGQHPNGSCVAEMLNEQFMGSCCQVTKCASCDHKSERKCPFTELTLGIQGHRNLSEALSAYFSEERLEWRCGSCTGKIGIKKVQLLKLPPVLVLQLNRFVFDRTTQRKKKLAIPLHFTRQLDLTPFVVAESGSSGSLNPSCPCEYDLTAVLVHQGASAYMGHYYALVEEQISKKWFKFNDQIVTELNGKKIPGADESEGSSDKPSSSLEAKGAYMLVYKRREKGGKKDMEIAMPDHCVTVLKNLTHHYSTAKERFNSTRDKKLKKATDKAKRMKELWNDLQVAEEDRNKPEQIAFLPVDFLREVQEKEVSDLGLQLESASDGSDDVKEIVDVSEEICNGAGSSVGDKEVQGRAEPYDPAEGLMEAEFSGGAKSSSTIDSVSLDDRPVAVEYRPEDSVCIHGKISLSDMANGYWRAVNIAGALKLFDSYEIAIGKLVTEVDLCEECIDDKVSEDKFTKDLEADWTYIAAELKNFPVNAEKDQLSLFMRKEYFWISRQSLNSFKKLAVSRRGETEQEFSDTGADECSTNKGRFFLAEDENEVQSGSKSTDEISRSEQVDEDQSEVENESHSTPIGRSGRFNSHLLCRHGGFTLDRKLRRLVPKRVWEIVRKYFPNAVEMSALTEECSACLGQKAEVQEDNKKKAEVALWYKDKLQALLKDFKSRTVSTIPKTPNQRLFYLLCRSYFDRWLEFLKNPKNFHICKHVCNDCLMCVHKRTKYPMQPEEYVSGPASTVCAPDFTWAGHTMELNFPFVILTPDEWSTLCYPEFGDEFLLEVDNEITLQFSPDGGYELTPGFCDECYAAMLGEKEMDRYRYENGKVFVQKVEENESDNAGPSPIKHLAPIFAIGVRRSSRRIKPRDSKDYDVNSSDTLQDLKLKIMAEEGAVPNDQHLSYEGKELTELSKTLFEYMIPDGAILKLQVDAPLPEDEVLAQAEEERVRRPERGFQGSVLTQRR